MKKSLEEIAKTFRERIHVNVDVLCSLKSCEERDMMLGRIDELSTAIEFIEASGTFTN